MKLKMIGVTSALFLGAAMILAPLNAMAGDCKGKKDIVDTAVAAGSFETLATALTKAGLIDALKGSGPFTVFAPSDEAFAKLPKGTLENLLKPENKGRLTAVLTYHVVPGCVPAEKAVKLTSAKTLNEQQIDLVAKDGNLTVDGAKVVKTDIECSNGVIHVIDKVILPSEKDIVATAEGAGTFKTLIAALNAADLAKVLQGDGPFTVFAPTDEAFAKLPEGTLDSLLKPESKDKLTAILMLHVASGRAFAADALEANKIPTLQKEDVRVRVVDGKPRVNDAVIIKTDIDAANGVIHVIDTVLMPKDDKRMGATDARGLINLAIRRGVPLFNQGDKSACLAVYEVAASGLLSMDIDNASRVRLSRALSMLESSHDAGEKAWILRHALDAVHENM